MPAPLRTSSLAPIALGLLAIASGCAGPRLSEASFQQQDGGQPGAPPQAREGAIPDDPTATGGWAAPAWESPPPLRTRQDIEDWPRHRIWGFVGGTTSREGSDFTAGLRYGYFPYGNIGFGALVDFTDREQDTWTGLLATFVRPTRHFQITVGAGLQYADGNNEPVIRTGAEYGFDLTESLSLVPGVSFDIVSNRANVMNLGLSLMLRF